MARQVRLDAKLDSYRTFLDYPWVQGMGALTDGTPLEGAFFDLSMAWKQAANNFQFQ